MEKYVWVRDAFHENPPNSEKQISERRTSCRHGGMTSCSWLWLVSSLLGREASGSRWRKATCLLRVAPCCWRETTSLGRVFIYIISANISDIGVFLYLLSISVSSPKIPYRLGPGMNYVPRFSDHLRNKFEAFFSQSKLL